MRLRQVLAGAACVAAAVTLARCGGDSATPPTTPTPIPTVAPTPTPTPGIVLPPGMVCDPTPPPLLGINAGKWRPRSESGWILDSNPIVPNVDHYCARVGFGEWRFCNTRPEGDEQRIACDYLAVGIASDTGRWGPTWTIDGKPCDGQGNCLNHSENQFKAIGKGPGYYEACASPLAKVYTGDDPYPGTRCGVLDWQ
jgi:hypothetical protein